MGTLEFNFNQMFSNQRQVVSFPKDMVFSDDGLFDRVLNCVCVYDMEGKREKYHLLL